MCVCERESMCACECMRVLLNLHVSENLLSYDHLSECLSKILDERPNNSVGKL